MPRTFRAPSLARTYLNKGHADLTMERSALFGEHRPVEDPQRLWEVGPLIRVTVVPRSHEKLYGLLVKKEIALRNKNQGTLHRSGGRKKWETKWVHKTFRGWIRFQESLGGMTVVLVRARNRADEWQLLTSFIGFLHRHFSDSISTITISLDPDG
jgi:hypothetical protein